MNTRVIVFLIMSPLALERGSEMTVGLDSGVFRYEYA